MGYVFDLAGKRLHAGMYVHTLNEMKIAFYSTLRLLP